MRISLEWLAEYVDIDLADPALPEHLALGVLMSGLEAEVINRPGEWVDRLLVAEVLSAEKHPNADKLTICRVHDGTEERGIVCGAPNVDAGQKVVLAPPGATLPGGMEIKVARIRGEESQGMLCSERELGIGHDHSGIIVLDPDSGTGEPAAPVLGLDDVIFEITVTPNRGDCLSVLGVAREVAALFDSPLKIPVPDLEEETGERADSLCGVEILDPDKCPRYVARVIRGVRIGPSPGWMQRRLRAAGMRPINNIVDITNYVLLSLGQPLHGFDLDKLAERRIVVRRWRREDGPFTTLDGQVRKVTEEDLMICDAERPVAIGGVMGGSNSEISDATGDILLESAYFSPSTIRSTRRRLNISTEASFRFERGVDPSGTLRAADWAAQLIRQYGGGRIAEGAVDVHPAPAAPVRLGLRSERVSKILGAEIGTPEIRRNLESIGMSVLDSENGRLEVEVPVFRHDIDREIDLIEEVARRWGYENFPSSLPATASPPALPPSPRRLEKEIREAMISAGFTEVLNYSFVGRSDLERLGNAGEDVVPLQNPLSAEMDVMRTTLLAGLIGNAAMNLNRGAGDLRLFEIGRTFHRNPDEKLPNEVRRIAALVSEVSPDVLWPEGRSPGGEEALPARLFDLKGALERMGRQIRLSDFRLAPVEGEISPLDPNEAAWVMSGELRCGTIGGLNKAVLEAWGVRQRLFVFELDIEALGRAGRRSQRLQPVPRFPATLRDLAIVVENGVTNTTVEELLRRIGGEWLESAALFDIYRDAALIGSGEKSLAYSLVFRHLDRTLNDEEVDQVFWEIVRNLESQLGARLRS